MRSAFALLLAALAHAHPTLYPRVGGRDVDCAHAPAVLSYHIHVVYSLNNDDIVAAAEQLRNIARGQFAQYLGQDCDGR